MAAAPRMLEEQKRSTGTSTMAQVPPAVPGKSYVVNRQGQRVEVRFDKITDRIQDLCSAVYGRELTQIDPPLITQQVMLRFKNGITTHDIDLIVVRICADYGTRHRDYPELAARIQISDLQRRTHGSFLETVNTIHAATDTENKSTSRLAPELLAVARKFSREIEQRIAYRRDFRIGSFGIETLMRSYLLRRGEALAERPQHMYMRVALGCHCCLAEQIPDDDMRKRLEDAFAMYDALSLQEISHASPTLFNAGTSHPQLSSCFQLGTADDLGSLLETVKDAGLISKWAGGISIRLTELRAAGSKIRSTGGESTGILHYAQMLNRLQIFVNQGGFRNGAFAAYLEPWHDDIFTFLEIPRHQGPAAKLRTNSPDLKYALWVPDNFMVALRDNKDYYLMSPDRSPGLERCHGSEFTTLYERYIVEGRFTRKVPARKIFAAWWKTVSEVGNPYWLFKDHINHKSNMQNVATTGSSNLCVAAGTAVLTSTGHLPIETLVGQELEVWNGVEWSTVTVRQTGKDRPLVRVVLDDGAELTCTPGHKFYDDQHAEVRANNLTPGIRLEKATAWPVIEGGVPFVHAYAHGLFCADGHYHTQNGKPPGRCYNNVSSGNSARGTHATCQPMYSDDGDGRCRGNVGRFATRLYGGKQKLCDHEHFTEYPLNPGLCIYEKTDRATVYLPDDLGPKYAVPINALKADRLRWLEGYGDGDGCVCRNGTSFTLQFTSTSADFLQDIRLLMQTLGCDPKVRPGRPAGMITIRGQTWKQQATHRLLVSPTDLAMLIEQGFEPARLDLQGFQPPNRDARRFVRVKQVEELPELGNTYCFTEPLRHRAVFNGILTGQCAEVTIPSWVGRPDDPDPAQRQTEYGVCTLGALCLESYVVPDATAPQRARLDWEKLIDRTKGLTKNLDRVIDVNYYPVEPCRRSSLRHRPIGIGILGLADVFHRMKLAYGATEARDLDEAIAASVYYGAMAASSQLAEELGPYETMNGSPAGSGRLQPDLWVEHKHLDHGWEARVEKTTGGSLTPEMWSALRDRLRAGYLRNAYVTAYMPTASTSNIVGQNECFEAFTSNLYLRRTIAGEFVMMNKHLLAELEEADLWDDEMRRALIASGGSTRRIERIPAELRRRYRTVREMDQRVLTLHAAKRAPFICQSMSLNYYFTAPTVKDLATILMLGWEKGLKTGSYYIHSRPAAGAQQTSIMEPKPSRAARPERTPERISSQLSRGASSSQPEGEPGSEIIPRGECTACAL